MASSSQWRPFPPAEMSIDPRKETLGSIDVVRDMLDYASTVEEALDILPSINVDMTGGAAPTSSSA